jgi:hypothetical protein
MRKQPLETQTLYGELVERLVAFEAERAIGHAPGSFVTKTIGGNTYYYFQHSEPGGSKRQLYVGRRDDVLDRVVHRYREARDDVDAQRESIRRLCASLRAGGALAADNASGRVIRALSDAGVFALGGVLVGTHAFTVLGNVLGAVWEGAGLRTQDIDIAADTTLRLAVGALPDAPVPDVLESLEMGFVPVPGLDPEIPSTSFVVRGQGLRVDLLTPMRGRPEEGPVKIARFQAAATPLRLLDYLMEDPVRAAVVDGEGILVSVPNPARFALHKLLLLEERSVVAHAKREKDLLQAREVLALLVDERPGDIALAWDGLESRGSGWTRRVRAGLSALAQTDQDLAAEVEASL